MGRKSTKGTKQVGLELAEELVDQLREFARDRGETVRQVVEAALRRHFAYPPPPPPPPTPPPAPAPFPVAGPAAQPTETRPGKRAGRKPRGS